MSETPPMVYVVYETTEDDQIRLLEAHVSAESAEAAMKTLHSGTSIIDVEELELKSIINGTAKGDKVTTKKSSKKSKKRSSEGDEDGLANSIKDSRKTLPNIPGAQPGVLKGLKLLFTGTMTKDRKTCQATGIMYGAHMVSNPEKADYVVLGTKPGAKKLEAIQQSNAETITEEQFYAILSTGVPDEKRRRMAVVVQEEIEQTDQDDSEDDEPPRKQRKSS